MCLIPSHVSAAAEDVAAFARLYDDVAKVCAQCMLDVFSSFALYRLEGSAPEQTEPKADLDFSSLLPELGILASCRTSRISTS